MRHQVLLTLLSITVVGCRTHHSPSITSAPPTPPDVISTPVGFAGSPALTPPQIESIRSLLSKQEFKEMAFLQAALPAGLRFMPARYSLISPVDTNGRPIPCTETISVCRLNEDRDGDCRRQSHQKGHYS